MNRSTTPKETVIAGWILVSISVFLTASIVFWYKGTPEVFLEQRVGFTSQVFNNPVVWLFTFGIVLGYILYTVKAVPFVHEHLFTFSWLKMIGVWAAIVTGIMEEVVFRQMFMDWMMNMNLSVITQIVGSGIVFGLAHGTWVLLRGELRIATPVIVSTTVLGLLLAMLYIVADRSTFAPIVAHILINLTIEPWLILAAVSGKWHQTISIKE